MQYVAVEKDDGSNFAFEYGDMAMLHYRILSKEKEKAAILASASHTVAERLGINGYA